MNARRLDSPAAGVAFTLASAIFLSGLGVTTQLAYDAGATLGTLLSGRFLIAAAILWALVAILRSPLPGPRAALEALLLGVAFSAHAWLFSASLARLDAGLVDLLLFTYPALVTLAAVALKRERWSSRRAIALVMALVGTALVLLGGVGGIDPLGAALALASAAAYAAYILSSAGQLERTNSFVLIALVSSGAAVTLTIGAAAHGEVALDAGPSTFASIAVVALVAVAGMGTFVAGIDRLGPSRASIVSAVQPALTPVVGFAVFSDRLGPAQVLGAALVVTGVVILELRGRPSRLPWRPSWLPRRERWALVRATATLRVPTGAGVLREGAAADAFYLIERGEARVRREDDEVAQLGPGDFFGELALLGGGARTASVIAETDLRLRVLPNHEFARAMQTLPTLAGRVRDAAMERLGVVPAFA
jgi:drug/metabolite transporter (DMT)-like permease